MRVAGIGCRRGVSAEEVLAAIAGRGALDALAVIAAKRAEPGVIAAARALGLPLLVADGVVDEARLATRSAASLAAVGVGSACEAAALAVAGRGALLEAPRRIVGRVTCAVAVSGETA